jgi:hypothetical protein
MKYLAGHRASSRHHILGARYLVYLLLLWLLGLPAAAQYEQFTLNATKAETAPVIDGVLDEAVWVNAPSAGDFIQFVPNNGQPASMKTIVRVLYDDQFIYFGFLAYDPAPQMIQLGTGKRDGLASSTGTDSVTVMLDTFDDNQTGYFFRTNIDGVQHDGRITDNGRADDIRWDGIWQSAGSRSEEGWSAEIAIPLETVKFEPGTDRKWGVQFGRYIPRNLEQSFWTGPLQEYRRVSVYGSITGLDLQRSEKRLELIPNVRSRFQEEEDPSVTAGLDARYSVSQLASVHMTVNPDFATVEADQEQVNLTRFELNLPEKRNFFLEDNQLYKQRIQLFYSRRISDIWGGAKVYGKRSGYELSAMSTQTKEDEELVEKSANFSTLRLKRDVMGSSTIGFLGANKYVDGANQGTVGLDTSLYFTDTFSFTGQLAGSYGTGKPSDYAFFVRPSYDTDTFHIHIRHTYLGDNFADNANAVGFIRDDNRRELDSAISKKFWLENRYLERIDYRSNYNVYWSVENELRSWDIYQSLTFDLRNKFSVTVRADRDYQLFEKGFDNYAGRVEVGYNTREWQQVRLAYQKGKNFDSDFELWEGLVQFNVTRQLSLEYDLTRLILDPDPENETTWIHVVRAIQTFTPDLFVSLFYQNNSSIDKHNIQALLVYRFQPPFGLVQVAYQRGTARFGEAGNQGNTLFLKFAYVF